MTHHFWFQEIDLIKDEIDSINEHIGEVDQLFYPEWRGFNLAPFHRWGIWGQLSFSKVHYYQTFLSDTLPSVSCAKACNKELSKIFLIRNNL